MKKQGDMDRRLVSKAENNIDYRPAAARHFKALACRIFPGLSFCYLGGVLLVVALPALPRFPYEYALLPATGLLLIARQIQLKAVPIFRPCMRIFLAAFLLAILMTSWQSRRYLAAKLASGQQVKTVTVTGWVASLPKIKPASSAFQRTSQAAKGQDARFLFQPDTRRHQFPETIQINWYRDAPAIVAGQYWQLKLRVKEARGKLNFSGFDYERWLFRHNIGALATVISGTRSVDERPSSLKLKLLSWRAALSSRLEQTGTDISPVSLALIRALAVADKSTIDPRTQDLFARTGTAHLLAISGLHIGLVAVTGLVIGRFLALLLVWLVPAGYAGFTQIISRQRLMLIPAIVLALIYATLAGWSLPTQRAVIMLLVLSLGVWSRRRLNAWQAWSLALLLVLVLDPLSVLDAGFWLSFIAVALLIAFVGNHAASNRWLSMLRAQWVVILGLLPLSLIVFSRIPLASFLSNLVAIPLTGFLLVPLILLAILTTTHFPQISTTLLSAAGWLLDRLLEYLVWLDAILPVFEITKSFSNWQLIYLFLTVLLLLLPRGLPRFYLFCVLVLPLIVPVRSVGETEMSMEVLDVGQGLAVLLISSDGMLLYDSGPGDGRQWDLVASVLQPAIDRSGIELSQVVVSHADLDHAGGLHSLAIKYPDAYYYVNKPKTLALNRCTTKAQISGPESAEMGLNILHPNPELPYQGNNSSCVLLVNFGRFKILLTGDISSTVEERLLRQYPDLVADILLVPHHGSRTSSSEGFLTRLKPQFALLSTGYGNRFHLPAGDVLQRYQDLQIHTLDTAICGAIRFNFNISGELSWETARGQRRAIWREVADACY